MKSCGLSSDRNGPLISPWKQVTQMTNFPAVHYPELPPFYVCRLKKQNMILHSERIQQGVLTSMEGCDLCWGAVHSAVWKLGCRVALWWRSWIKAGGQRGARGDAGTQGHRDRKNTINLAESDRAPARTSTLNRLSHPPPPSAKKKPQKRKTAGSASPLQLDPHFTPCCVLACSLCRVTHRSPSSQSALLLFKTKDKWGVLKSVLAAGLHWVETLHGAEVSCKLFMIRQVFLRCLGTSWVKQKEKHFLSSSYRLSACGCEAVVVLSLPPSPGAQWPLSPVMKYFFASVSVRSRFFPFDSAAFGRRPTEGGCAA